MSEDLVNLLADLKEEEVLAQVKKRLDAGDDPYKILDETSKGMAIVGKRFAGGEYFLPELVYSGEVLKQVNALLKPKLGAGKAASKKIGKVVIGTVAGDIHDIGLNIVEFMLDVNGFDVTNLGVDVPKEKFVEAVKQTKAPGRRFKRVLDSGLRCDERDRRGAGESRLEEESQDYDWRRPDG